ncbi:MAG: hypothetical protein GX786_08240, partial [Clostridiales bacterium]|nr:hypothetical protein [Clostridiales bacterium]
MKKIITLILACMLVFTLTACTKEEKAEEIVQETPTTDSGTVSETEEKDVAEISWFLSAGVVPSTWDQTQYVMGHITEKTGVTVAATTPADDPDTKLNLMIVNGELPDLLTLTNETLIKDLIEADLVWPLESFFSEYMADSHIVNGGFPQDIKEKLITRDGGWYSFP